MVGVRKVGATGREEGRKEEKLNGRKGEGGGS